jgi:hypothetical protein
MLLDDQAFCRYCIPMDSPRPLLPTELEFFNKGTGKGMSNLLVSQLPFFVMNDKSSLLITSIKSCANREILVPLVVIFTKFDAQIIQESVKLHDLENYEDKWAMARKNADITFQSTYLARILGTQHPPRAYVRLEGEGIKHFNRYGDNDLA